jgi:hypothetical protein
MAYISISRARCHVRWLAGLAAALGTLTISSVSFARDDILVTFDASTALTLMQVDGFSADMGLLRGTASLQTEDAYCVPSADRPCHYIVNFVRIEVSTFALPTSEGEYTAAEPFSVVQGPIAVVDTGSGIVIPQGAQSVAGANFSGPHIDPGVRSSTQGLPGPLSINLDAVNQAFSIEGEFRTSLEGHTGIGTIIASGNRPFVNLPPVADLRIDGEIVCPQPVILDACRSFDPNDRIQLFRWSSGGLTLASSTACSASVRLAAGRFDILLEVFDGFGGRATDQESVTVTLGDDPSCCPAGYRVIVGTSNNDNLVGTSGNDCIVALGAQDTISGGGGNDLISAGQGDDVIDAGAGEDTVYAGWGQDQVTGGGGNDLISGGDGDDVCRGGTGDDTLRGGQGQDRLFGEGDADVLLGDDGDDRLDGGAGDDLLAGGGLHDSCTGGLGTNTFTSCETRPDAPSAPSSCADGVQNALETDVDCGGLACASCALGFGCDSGADCVTNICSAENTCHSRGGAASPLQASLSFSTDWGTGYCATLDVTNATTGPITTWSVLIDTNQSSTFTTWNGSFGASAGAVTILAFDWNRTLDPGETDRSIGFCANRNVPGSGTLPFVVSTTVN